MARPLEPTKQTVSYSIAEAAAATGYSETTIKAWLEAGLPKRYGTDTKPVIRFPDLYDWVDRLPSDRPSP